MRGFFYQKLALSNIRKHSRFYLPNILTGIGLTATFFIILTLAGDERLKSIRGGSYLPTFMFFGSFILGLLSFVLILYANAFLMRQRKKELGLYNILGMEKRHVAKVLFYEQFFAAALSILFGLITGIIFYKICTLIICRLLRVPSVLGLYYIKGFSLLFTTVFFAVIYLLTFLWNLLELKRMKPVELLNSSHTGEKEPRIKWLLLLIGMNCLAAGYYIALTTESPLAALNKFFLAVILVIVATYCLFITGIISLLKALKKNKKYYYKKEHMAVVSGLIYRMKQNAVGLSSICILSCAVLVMLSTTFCLYFGIEENLNRVYPYKYYISANVMINGESRQLRAEELTKIVEDAAKKSGNPVSQSIIQRSLSVSYAYEEGGYLSTDMSLKVQTPDLVTITYVTADDYELMTGKKLDLLKGQIALCYFNVQSKIKPTALHIADRDYQVTQVLDYFPVRPSMQAIMDCFGVVLPTDEDMQAIDQAQKAAYEVPSQLEEVCAFHFADESPDAFAVSGPLLVDEINKQLSQMSDNGGYGTGSDDYWSAREESYGMYGTLLFLGLLLGFVFLFATALIIYYKQISEGYEDRNRFQIMEKIGLSEKESKMTIRRQILMVFFLPLVVSGVHIMVAFKILTLLLHIFLATDDLLFAGCTLVVYIGFALIYTLIYSYTAKVYYKIVH